MTREREREHAGAQERGCRRTAQLISSSPSDEWTTSDFCGATHQVSHGICTPSPDAAHPFPPREDLSVQRAQRFLANPDHCTEAERVSQKRVSMPGRRGEGNNEVKVGAGRTLGCWPARVGQRSQDVEDCAHTQLLEQAAVAL